MKSIPWTLPQLAGIGLLTLLLCACGNGGEPTDRRYPNQSYIFPTAIIGIPVQSEDEAQRIKSALNAFADHHGLQRSAPTEDPRLARMNAPARRRTERETYYHPPGPWIGEGFSVRLHEFSPQCMLVSLSEFSGIWREETLNGLDQLKKVLAEATQGRALLLVRPKSGQNWPEQQHFDDWERPTYLETLCVRMGLPDPRSPEEIAAQGPLK